MFTPPLTHTAAYISVLVDIVIGNEVFGQYRHWMCLVLFLSKQSPLLSVLLNCFSFSYCKHFSFWVLFGSELTNDVGASSRSVMEISWR